VVRAGNIAAREPIPDRLLQRRPDALDRALGAWRHQSHRRQCRLRGGAQRQLEPAIASPHRVGIRFQRRRCAAEDHRHIAPAGAIDRDVAGVVAHAFMLLERRVVLLVDDDQAQIGRRREYGKPRSDDQLRLAAGRRQPLAAPFRGAEPAMQHRNARAGKRFGDPLLELRGQTDLRNEQQCLASCSDDLARGREIYGRLAAARHALQQRGLKAALLGYRSNECGALIGIELVCVGRSDCLRHRLDPTVSAPRAEQPPGVRA
jgi:hypothetical protein